MISVKTAKLGFPVTSVPKDSPIVYKMLSIGGLARASGVSCWMGQGYKKNQHMIPSSISFYISSYP